MSSEPKIDSKSHSVDPRGVSGGSSVGITTSSRPTSEKLAEIVGGQIEYLKGSVGVLSRPQLAMMIRGLEMTFREYRAACELENAE